MSSRLLGPLCLCVPRSTPTLRFIPSGSFLGHLTRGASSPCWERLGVAQISGGLTRMFHGHVIKSNHTAHYHSLRVIGALCAEFTAKSEHCGLTRRVVGEIRRTGSSRPRCSATPAVIRPPRSEKAGLKP